MNTVNHVIRGHKSNHYVQGHFLFKLKCSSVQRTPFSYMDTFRSVLLVSNISVFWLPWVWTRCMSYITYDKTLLPVCCEFVPLLCSEAWWIWLNWRFIHLTSISCHMTWLIIPHQTSPPSWSLYPVLSAGRVDGPSDRWSGVSSQNLMNYTDSTDRTACCCRKDTLTFRYSFVPCTRGLYNICIGYARSHEGTPSVSICPWGDTISVHMSMRGHHQWIWQVESFSHVKGTFSPLDLPLMPGFMMPLSIISY